MSTDLDRYTRDDLPSAQVSENIAHALEGLKAIRTFVKQQFKPGIDFGVIPGCGDKPTLFLPGAQKAMMYFNARPKRTIERVDLGDGHAEYIVTTKIVSRATREFIGEGLGCCSTMESKYRYRKGDRKCPACGKATIIVGKEEYGGGYICFLKKGGCGAKFRVGEKRIESQPTGQVENPDIFDMHNTVLKMAKKRADVDAAMTLGCLSELFTQDIEDTFPMVQVREAIREEAQEPDQEAQEPDPYHVDGEIMEKTLPGPRSSPGLFTKEHVAFTAAFNDWVSKKCLRTNEFWHLKWDDVITRALEDGHAVPDKIQDVINPWQAKGHLMKWAIDAGRLDASIVPEEQRTRQADAYLALVFYRSDEDKAAVKAEMASYVSKQRQLKSDAIYRKHPDLAPDGWQAEQDEVARAHADDDHGDAYEGPDDTTTRTNGLTEDED